MRITIRHLRGFVEVAKLGSFTKAAETLRISQPALTVTINQLEEDLNTKLLERTTRSVKPTENGKEFLEIADRLVMEFDSGLTTFSNGVDRKQHFLSVGEASSIGICMLPQILPLFKEKHPHFNLKFESAADCDVQAMVKQEKVAFAISSPWELDPELQYRQIAEDTFGIAVSQGHPLARNRGPIHWSELDGQTVIIGGTQETAVWGFLSKEKDLPHCVKTPSIEASQTSTMLMLAEQGLGVAIVPEFSWKNWPNKKLVFRQLVSPEVTREIRLVSKRHRHFSKEIKTLMDLYAEHAAMSVKGGFAKEDRTPLSNLQWLPGIHIPHSQNDPSMGEDHVALGDPGFGQHSLSTA